MSTRTLVITVLVAAAALAAAFVAYTSRFESTASQRRLLFPDLEQRVNDVASLAVRSGENRARLERADGEWRVEGKSGYPARAGKVRSALLGLAAAEIVEQKTDNPDLYSELGLGDPEAGGEALRVALADSQGEAIASLDIGDQLYRRGESFAYARRGGEKQTWMIQASFDTPSDPMQWIDNEILRFPRARIQSVTIDRSDGRLIVHRQVQADEDDFTLVETPEGYEPPGEDAARKIAGGLNYLGMDDVAAEGEIELSGVEPITAVYRGRNGLRITVRLFDIDPEQEGAWSRVEAAFEPPDESSSQTAPSAEQAENESERSDEIEEARRQAERLKDKLAGWMFKLSESKVTVLRGDPPPPRQAPEGGEFAPTTPQPPPPSGQQEQGESSQGG